ncbi:XylR family transcriptional regulator [Luteolibacter sp. AS25]|uniref:XylR family transcriptional regulator n=1 Tax=Luteolibacter sp. AS25 TaxID=3135776 RepID=UPI00398A51DD
MKRIAILVETSLASGRGILDGISRYVDERPDWSVFQHVGPLGAMSSEALRDWQGDGIIARIANPESLAIIQEKNLPTVDVLGNISPLPYPLFKCNDSAIGKSVAEHFLESAHKNFAFIGLGNERWSIEREEAFTKEIEVNQYKVASFHMEKRLTDHMLSGDSFEAIKSWLRTLPLPTGIMVASDQFGPILFEACHQLKLSIPDRVSVVGVDNDGPFSNLCRPRLSSIMPDHEQVGYLAAKGLSDLIEGRELPKKVVEVDKHTLHRRISSEFVAIEDPSTLTAIKYIREQASNSPSLDEVAKVSGLSRSVLQRRFRHHLNRTVGDLILSEKLRLAREMLSSTDLPIAVIAERTGLNSQEYMNRIFKQHLQTTPRKYRLHL